MPLLLVQSGLVLLRQLMQIVALAHRLVVIQPIQWKVEVLERPSRLHRVQGQPLLAVQVVLVVVVVVLSVVSHLVVGVPEPVGKVTQEAMVVLLLSQVPVTVMAVAVAAAVLVLLEATAVTGRTFLEVCMAVAAVTAGPVKQVRFLAHLLLMVAVAAVVEDTAHKVLEATVPVVLAAVEPLQEFLVLLVLAAVVEQTLLLATAATAGPVS